MTDLSNFIKEKCTINMMKANVVALKYLVIFALLFSIPYYFIWGFTSKAIFGEQGVIASSLSSFLLLIAGIILHELVHGFFFALFAKGGMKSVKFGIMWKYMTPYAHCSEPLKIRNYTVALLAPLILVGILPGTAGIAMGNFMLTATGIIMCAGAAGDLMIYSLIRKENPEDLVQDHPSEAGYYIFRRKSS